MIDRYSAPFTEIPSGLAIAQWFVRHSPKQHGYDGIDLWRGEGTTYCYLWITSMVDLDLTHWWLLEIRTAPTDEPFGETRDFLCVTWDFNGGVNCEWWNNPIEFRASSDEHFEHVIKGLEWFHQRVHQTIALQRGER